MASDRARPHQQRLAHSPRPRHRDRFPDAGVIFHLGLFTERRTLHLKPFAVARAVARALRRADEDQYTETLAWVVLPDQVQWLFVLRDFTTLSRPVREVKASSEREIAPMIEPYGPIWQPAFAETRIKDLEAAERLALDVVLTRAGSKPAGDPGAWSHWDAIWTQRWMEQSLLPGRSDQIGQTGR